MSNKELIDELRAWAEDDIVPGDLKSLLKATVKTLEKSESGHPPAPFVFPFATRITIVGDDRALFENYHAWKAGAELHQQDQGRTLKLFPKQY